MLCTVWSICIHAHILHVDICCKASFISCLIKTRDGITYIIIIYIHIHMIPYYNFGIKKKSKIHNSNMELFHTMHSWKKQPQSRNQFNLLPPSSNTTIHHVQRFSQRDNTQNCIQLNTSVEALLHQRGTTYNDIYIPTNTYYNIFCTCWNNCNLSRLTVILFSNVTSHMSIPGTSRTSRSTEGTSTCQNRCGRQGWPQPQGMLIYYNLEC